MSNAGVEADLIKAPSSRNKTTKVLRYSREFMLECAKSPLATRPKALPPMNVLFGESRPQNSDSSTNSAADSVEPNKKGTLKDVPHISTIGPMLASLMNKEGTLGGPNGTLMRSADKNIILGPPKMSFASSQKHALTSPAKGGEEGDRRPRTRLTGGDDQRTPKSFSNDLFASRAPKTPADREKGFSRDGGERSTRRAAGERSTQSREGGNQFNGTGRASHGQNKDRIPVDGGFKSSTRRRNQSPGHRVSSDNNPDWMDYDPTQEGVGNETDAGKDRIQIWKQQMKEKERDLTGEPDSADKKSKAVSRADASSSWRVGKSGGIAIEQSESLALESSETPSLERCSTVEGANDEKLKQTLEPIGDNIDNLFGPSYNGTSQFERFLRKSGAANEPSPVKSPTEPSTEESRFSRLFRKGQGKEDNKPTIPPTDSKTGGQFLMDMLKSNVPALSTPGSASLSTALQPGKKVITEDELLRKFGAKVPQTSEQDLESSNDFSFLMDKLTKGLGGTGVAQNTSNAESAAPERPKSSGLPIDPSILGTTRTRPSSPDGSSILAAFVKGSHVNPTSTVESAKPKPNLILDGNVPTSVYRQLSGRSEVARTLASSQSMISPQSAPPRPASPASHLPIQRSFPPEMYRQTMAQPPLPSPPLVQQQPIAPNMLTAGLQSNSMQPSAQRSMSGMQMQPTLAPQSRIDQFFGLAPPGPPQLHSHPPPPAPQSYGFNHQQQRFPPPPPPPQLQQGTRYTPQQLALLHHHQQQQQQFHLHQQHAQPPPPPSHLLQQHPQYFLPPHHSTYLANDAMLSANMPGYGGFVPSLVQAAASLGQQHLPQPQQYLTGEELEPRGFSAIGKRDGNDYRSPGY